MTGLVVTLIVMGLIVGMLVVLKGRRRADDSGEPWPFYAKRPLSQPEQVLYYRLVKILPDHMVLAQVSLSRLLGVKAGHNAQAWFNRINRMSADFVVCRKDSSVVAVIELDDSSHVREERQVADRKKGTALQSAGIRLLRWNVKALPDEETIKSQLLCQEVSAQSGSL